MRILLSLGQSLSDGDVLIDDGTTLIVLRIIPCTVLAIRPRSITSPLAAGRTSSCAGMGSIARMCRSISSALLDTSTAMTSWRICRRRSGELFFGISVIVELSMLLDNSPSGRR